jgi:hypothetical protein
MKRPGFRDSPKSVRNVSDGPSLSAKLQFSRWTRSSAAASNPFALHPLIRDRHTLQNFTPSLLLRKFNPEVPGLGFAA